MLALLLGVLAVSVLLRLGKLPRLRRLVARWRPLKAPAARAGGRELRLVVTEPGQHLCRFASVGGAAAAKAALLRLCARLHVYDAEISDIRSGAYRAGQAAIGAVLHGPPGCGKTLLARALAGELNLPLFTISGVDLEQLPPATWAAPLRELFATAVERAPSLIFIDNLDALKAASAKPAAASAADPETSPGVLTLVSLLDELSRQQAGVAVLGAARRLEAVDEALVRPDRLGRAIALALPEPRERAEIIALLARSHPTLDNLDVLALAARTDGYSGADLGALLARLARLVAERPTQPAGPPSIEPAELERALSEAPPPARPPTAK